MFGLGQYYLFTHIYLIKKRGRQKKDKHISLLQCFFPLLITDKKRKQNGFSREFFFTRIQCKEGNREADSRESSQSPC